MKHPLIIAGAVVAVIAINSASDSDSDGGTTYPTGPTAQTEVSFKAQVPIMDISPGGRWLLYVRVTNTGDTTSAPTCSVMAYDGDGYPLA